MTEQEAINFLEDEINGLKEQRDGILRDLLGEIAEKVFWEINGEERISSFRTIIKFITELQQYREMDRKLREAYGDCDGLLEKSVDLLCEHAGTDIGNPIKARLLTDDDVDKWDAYQEVGTVEECRKAMGKQKPKAVKNRKLLKDFHGSPYCIQGDCPNCGCESIKATANDYCYVCGQHLKWDENLLKSRNAREKGREAVKGVTITGYGIDIGWAFYTKWKDMKDSIVHIVSKK